MSSNAEGTQDLFFGALVRSYVDENRRFLRRDWLAQQLDERLREAGKQFVLLTAEPGAGKSAFLAQLAHDHPDWLRYFIRRDQRSVLADVSDKSLLLRIGYQLAALNHDLFTQEQLRVSISQRIGQVAQQGEAVGAEVKRLTASPFYQKILQIEQQVQANQGKVIGLWVDELVVETRLLPAEDLLHLALIDPARALQRIDSKRHIIILIDALDEIRYHATTENILAWLTNCPAIPNNIRFVLTSRPPDEILNLFRTKQADLLAELAIAEEDTHVKQDIQRFVTKLVGEPQVAQILQAAKSNAKIFAREATLKAHGNMGYLDALARGIDQAVQSNDHAGLQALLSLKELPGDLGELYAFFLHQIKASVSRKRIELRDPGTGETYDKPIWPAVYNRILGVLAVAMEPLDIELIDKVGGINVERSWVLQALERLLQFLDVINGRYRLYHATVAEFLTNKKTHDNAGTQDLYQDATQWHRQIAEYYWARRKNHGNWLTCDDYGIRELVHHMMSAGQTQEVIELLTGTPEWKLAKQRDGERGASYEREISMALQRLSDIADAQMIHDAFSLTIARLTIKAKLDYFPDKEVELLMLLRRDKEALGIANLTTDASKRFRILLALVKKNPQQPWETALKAALAIHTDWQRAPALIELADTLAHTGRRSAAVEALEIAFKHASVIQNSANRSAELRRIVVLFLECDEIAHAKATVPLIESSDDRIAASIQIGWKLIAINDNETAARIIYQCAEDLSNQSSFISPLTYIALAKALIALGERDKADIVFDDAHSAVFQYSDWADRRDMQLRVIEALAQCGFVEKAETLALSHGQTGGFVSTLIELRQVKRALSLLDRMPEGEERDEAVAMAVLGLIRERSWIEARQRANSITTPFWRAKAYFGFLADEGQVLGEIITTINAIQNPDSKSFAFRLLALSLVNISRNSEAENIYQLALVAARDSHNEHSTSETAKSMAAHGFISESIEVMQTINDPFIRGNGLRDISLELAKKGDLATAGATYESALAALEENENRWALGHHAKVLQRVATWMAERGFHSVARKIFDISARTAERILGDECHRAVKLDQLFDRLAAFGYDDLMFDIAERIREDHYGTRSKLKLKSAAAVARNRGRLQTEPLSHIAETALDNVDERKKPKALVDLCRAFLEAGFHERATRVLYQAFEIFCDNSRSVDSRETLIGWLIKALGEHKRVDDAVRLASCTTDDYPLAELVICLANSGRLTEAADTLKRVKGYWRDEACRQVAIGLLKSGNDQEAETWISRIEDRAVRANALLAAVEARMKVGRINSGVAAADQVLSIIQSLNTPNRRTWTARLALAVSECKDSVTLAKYADEALSLPPDTFSSSENESREKGLLSDLLMAQGKFIQSLTVFGESSALGLIERVLRNSERLDAIRDGLAHRVLRTVVRIFAWNDADWRNVYVSFANGSE